jgi:predicted ATP-dependent serine protease
VTGKDVENMTFKTYKFAPEWSELLGEPSKPFDFMVYGDAKAGKSYFAMNLAQYLTSFGDVAYFAIEEGLSATTQKKIETTGAKDIFLHQSTTIEEVSEELESEKYKFAFIDSASALSMSAEQFQELRSHFPETSFVLIMHTTKSNEFAGEKRWKHDVQAILEVTKEGLRSTKVQCIGRFGTGEKIICW